MDQRNDLVGEAAVDLLVSMIHNGLSGVPKQPIATQVTSQWVAGKTIRGGANNLCSQEASPAC
jgi:LacI family transcriptional regulator